MSDESATAANGDSFLDNDEAYKHIHPHPFHLQLSKHHKTDGGIPYVTIAAQRRSRAILKLINGLVLKEEFFLDHDPEQNVEGDDGGEGEDDVDDGSDDLASEGGTRSSLQEFTLDCARASSQLNVLTSSFDMKYPFSQMEVCTMVLKIVELLCATVKVDEIIDIGDNEGNKELKDGVSAMAIENDNQQKKSRRVVTIHHDNVGYIHDCGDGANEDGNKQLNDDSITAQQLEDELSLPFALPAPARRALLEVALQLLGKKKDGLRGVGSSAIFVDENNNNNQQLIISHHALLRMLLRTAPYLDEHKVDIPPKESIGIRSSVLRRTVTLIRSCRSFFFQGDKDATARQLWQTLKNDLQFHTHSNSHFRALILMYLFHPTKCSSGYYEEMLPLWMECWRGVDRCPEGDYLWMVLISRARKFLPPNTPFLQNFTSNLRKHLLTSCGYWLHIPVGGVSADKSFPRAGTPSKRSFPIRLKVFCGYSGGRYEEGIDFVRKLCKLLMFCAGSGNTVETEDDGEQHQHQSTTSISEGTADILRFLSFIAPYFNPSNTGNWTFPLGAFLHYLSYELCARVGVTAGWKVLQRDHVEVAGRLIKEEPYLENVELDGCELVALLDGMLPLCQQALFSKNATVSHAGESALLYIAQIDPARVSPPLIDFSLRSLDIGSVNLSHQAPVALSALSRLLQPTLRHRPELILSRLPDMLRLTLAGIDSNDQNKSLRTLIFYRNLVMWIPVGGSIVLPAAADNRNSILDRDGKNSTVQVSKDLVGTRFSIVESEKYKSAIAALPQSSILVQQETTANYTIEDGNSNMEVLMQEAMLAMSDWSLTFLDRIFELLRAAGEQEKLGKGHGGVGMHHTSSDVAMTKNFSRIMKETLTYFFAAMDEKTYQAALRNVVGFLSEETLPFAVKDASLLCQSVCSTRFAISGGSGFSPTASIDRSPGLDALIPILTEDLHHKSSKCVIYRLRCLASSVRYAGSAVLKHRDTIVSAISFALSKSDDRVLFKTGCKLLRHTLSSQCEEYPIAQCFHPMRKLATDRGSTSMPVIGASAHLHGDQIWWHVPSTEQIDFTVDLLSQYALVRWKELGKNFSNNGEAGSVNLQQWRQTLRVMRYSLRGCSGILLDEDPNVTLSRTDTEFCPKEMATAKLILSTSIETQRALQGLRTRISFNLMDMMSLIATDTVDCESKSFGEGGTISTDSKICKEIIQLVELVLTRRGAQYSSSYGKTIWRGQKEILTDFCSASASDYICSALSRSTSNNESSSNVIGILSSFYYKDGENSGKTLSRVLIVNRIHLTNQALTEMASSQVPRRLRKLRGGASVESPLSLFSLNMDFQTIQERLCNASKCAYDAPRQTSLEAYEGLVDGLCALSCHPNINVRGDALSNADFALSRLGWLAKFKMSRLLAAITLNDHDLGGQHGIPSCQRLVDQVNSQGKHSRLAEVVKGATKIVALPKIMKQFLWGVNNRFELVKMLCGTQKLLKLIPPEEVPKVVHYVNSIFLSYRSKLFALPRNTSKDQKVHECCLTFLLDIVQEGSNGAITPVADSDKGIEDIDAGAMHWRDRLVAAWFVLQFVDERDLMVGDPKIVAQIWSMCEKLIEEEVGQPLQRVSLGLLGRLVSLALVDKSQAKDKREEPNCPDLSALHLMFAKEKFCRDFGNALAFDHREDSSVGGGHSAQWSSGVEEIIRDATSNLARRTLFPFNRISQKSHTFKLQHCQLMESILLAIGHDNAKVTSRVFLEQARELVASPPSEDQRNQQVASAEIFGGVCRALIQYSITEDERAYIWDTMLLPFLDEVIVKVPTNLTSAFFDACRYGIHHFPPSYFLPLLKWSVAKVKNTVWQHDETNSVEAEESNNGSASASSAMSDRFALQGKWLLFVQAVLAELDSEDDLGAVCKTPWYQSLFIENKGLQIDDGMAVTPTEIELGQSWKYVNDHLTPCLLNAIGHPYDRCRDHIASCLFRMCYCHHKFINTYKSTGDGSQSSKEDPGIEIIKKLSNIRGSSNYSFKDKTNALGTARKFVACCIHWGDAKHEYSEFIIPLLPLSFKSLQTIDGEASSEDRGKENELVKAYRYAIADISSSCVACYGVSLDLTRVLEVLKEMSGNDYWQIRQATAHFLRCFQGAHKFLFVKEQDDISLSIAISLLGDDRREVSSAATSTLTGILTVFPQAALEELVIKYIKIANKSLKKKNRKAAVVSELSPDEKETRAAKEKARSARQQKSVLVLCAVVMGKPYDTPPYIPHALAALSKHSFEQRASLSVREVVKMVCSEFKRTHTDNWEAHRTQFTQEQLEALEDVVDTPHYYA